MNNTIQSVKHRMRKHHQKVQHSHQYNSVSLRATTVANKKAASAFVS